MAVERVEAAKSGDIPLQEIAPSEVGELDLYQKRERIYTRKVEGTFQRIRLFTGWPLLLGYFILPWLSWDGRQAVLFDLPARQFHIFFISLWPQDLPLLAGLLIIAAFALFTVTVFAGRVWCGYTCPQTVWTSIFMWAEQVAEGTRNQRIKLDAAKWSSEKLAKKLMKHCMWMGFAALTGITFVAYFVPIDELLRGLLDGSAGFWAYAWSIFFTLATYINAGWMREQLCMYVCPYARFQAVMFDADTLVVSYDAGRGEPRGSRKKDADPQLLGLGHCIDCKMCVQVCPTGIDIREGLQHECITCALCIDACDAVMKKLSYPVGLIRYTTLNRLQGGNARILRPRLIGYLSVTLAMLMLFAYFLFSRVPLELDVIRERGKLFHTIQDPVDGLVVENIYQLQLSNMSQASQQYQVSIEGIDAASLRGTTTISVDAGESLSLPLRVRVKDSELMSGQRQFDFVVTQIDSASTAQEAVHQQQPAVVARAESRFLADER